MKMEVKGSVDGIDQEAMVDMQMFLEDSEIDLTAKVEGYGENLDQSYKGEYKENIQIAMDNTYYLTMICIILVIIALILTGLASLGKMSNKLGQIFALIALIFVLITLVYFPIGLPGAIKDNYNEGSSLGSDIFRQYDVEFDGSFIGETSSKIKAADIPGTPSDALGEFKIKWSWGPAYGWFLILIAFIFILIGIIISIFAKERIEEPEKEEGPEPTLAEQGQLVSDSRDIYSNKQSEDDFY
jgi:hypothetical protein